MSDMSDTPGPVSRTTTPEPPPESAVRPYITMAAFALIVGVVLAAYLWAHRVEIMAILTQTPI